MRLTWEQASIVPRPLHDPNSDAETGRQRTKYQTQITEYEIEKFLGQLGLTLGCKAMD